MPRRKCRESYEFRLQAVHFGFNPSGASGKKDGFREMDVQAVLSRLYGGASRAAICVWEISTVPQRTCSMEMSPLF